MAEYKFGAFGDPHIKPLYGEPILLDNSWKYCKLYYNNNENIMVIGECNKLNQSTINLLHKIENNKIVKLTNYDTYVKKYTYFTYIYVFKNNCLQTMISMINGDIIYDNKLITKIDILSAENQGIYSLTHNKYYPPKNLIKYKIKLDIACDLLVDIDNYWDEMNNVYLSNNLANINNISGELITHNKSNNIINLPSKYQINLYKSNKIIKPILKKSGK